MLYVALVNNIKNKNIRTGMYSTYFVSIFILKLCHDKKNQIDHLNLFTQNEDQTLYLCTNFCASLKNRQQEIFLVVSTGQQFLFHPVVNVSQVVGVFPCVLHQLSREGPETETLIVKYYICSTIEPQCYLDIKV